nr:hypothetical protein Iba_chr07bCG10510 [Ipomoea batatas]
MVYRLKSWSRTSIKHVVLILKRAQCLHQLPRLSGYSLESFGIQLAGHFIESLSTELKLSPAVEAVALSAVRRRNGDDRGCTGDRASALLKASDYSAAV